MKSMVIFCLLWCTCSIKTDRLDTSLLSFKLKETKEKMGVNYIQDLFNSLPYITKTEDGTQLLKVIQSNLATSLEALDNVLNQIKKEVFDNEQKFTTEATLPLCCEKTGTYKYDHRFRKEVDFSTACVTISPVASTNARFPHKDISHVMRMQYLNNKNALWQHYGTTKGISIIYPSAYWTDCKIYDPRFRSAFAETASSKDKDVVIVLDSSASMKQPSGVQDRSKLVIAKEAARTVLKTLNPNDRVAVLQFSSEVTSLNNCYQDTLAFASKANVDKLMAFVSEMMVSNDLNRNFTSALVKAFSLLGSSDNLDINSREQLILFLTNGESTDYQDPLSVIKEQNNKLQNRVILFTYLLGPGVTEAAKNQLKNMVFQTGRYEYLDHNQHKDLSIKMATFYLHLGSSSKSTPTYTVPYVDPFSEKGLITSMCIPVYVISGLHGIACTDVKVSELLKEVDYFEEGNSSYGFVIDGTGRALVHPLLPDAAHIELNEDPVLVDVATLERSSGSAEIISSMKRRETGSKTLQAVHFTLPRGRLENDGSSIRLIEATYFWGPVSNTNFVVCIVIGEKSYTEMTERNFPLGNIDLKNVFMYHNRSLVKESFADCRFSSRIVTTVKSSIKLTPSAFKDPFQYIDKEETSYDISGFTEYFTANTNQNPGFKNHVRPTIWATSKMDTFWKQSPATHLAWRYIGTTSGFMRVYPGVSMTKNYDHEKRTWWRQTVSHPGMMHITQPYQDAWGSGVLLSVTHTIYKRDSTQIAAVIGTDFPLSYFTWFIDQNVPQCTDSAYKCIIVDDSGFLVLHESFRDSRNSGGFEDPTHITEQEPVIAKAMIRQGVLTTHECQDFSKNVELTSYRVILPPLRSTGLDFQDTGDTFEIKPVAGSNIFILRIHSALDTTSYSCKCDKNVKPDIRSCNCDCLCHRPILYNVCKNQYNLANSILPCSARLLDKTGISVIENLTAHKSCYEPNCHMKRTKTECYSEAQCSWCEFTDKGDILNPPCCSLKGDCAFGKTKDNNRNICISKLVAPSNSNFSTVSKTAIIVGGSIGGIAFVVLLVVTVIIVFRCKLIRDEPEKDDNDPYLNAIPEFHDLKEFERQQDDGYAHTYFEPRDSKISYYDVPNN